MARAAELMRSAFEGLQARDVGRTTAFADESTYVDFVVLRPVVGKTALVAFFSELFTAVPDLSFEIVRILDVDEDTAVGEWRITGTFSGGQFQGIQPTGRPVDIRGIDVMEFADGVLRRNTVYYDGLRFARQVGLLPAEDSPGDRAIMAVFNALSRTKSAVRTRRASR